jgi:hypothetical protein
VRATGWRGSPQRSNAWLPACSRGHRDTSRRARAGLEAAGEIEVTGRGHHDRERLPPAHSKASLFQEPWPMPPRLDFS